MSIKHNSIVAFLALSICFLMFVPYVTATATVNGTFTLTSDNPVYVNGIDYLLNNTDGKIMVLSTGNMTDNSDYYINYQYIDHKDYLMDYPDGKISVLPLGGMEQDTMYDISYSIFSQGGAGYEMREQATASMTSMIGISGMVLMIGGFALIIRSLWGSFGGMFKS